jgi:hypothetical protein
MCRQLKSVINLVRGGVKLFFHEPYVDMPLADIELSGTGILDACWFMERFDCREQESDAQTAVKDFEIKNFRRVETITNLVSQHKASAKAATR